MFTMDQPLFLDWEYKTLQTLKSFESPPAENFLKQYIERVSLHHRCGFLSGDKIKELFEIEPDQFLEDIQDTGYHVVYIEQSTEGKLKIPFGVLFCINVDTLIEFNSKIKELSQSMQGLKEILEKKPNHLNN